MCWIQTYGMVFGQNRQEDLVEFLMAELPQAAECGTTRGGSDCPILEALDGRGRSKRRKTTE